ncbi:hypothetical protein K503DRAFT_865222 [Rhizopogon vinicolor AM-OR11-026]|uniref:WW domain-containing protein n=1 Tax=Rhizopogon vinicolor AM-OR11-026 TaxID=1314800 RepID=A0A1B7N496_9AGAM|nr:hypothetical protein K503DRAFT_865222 [Rhizopogon vinicolor AM-OR11-026]
MLEDETEVLDWGNEEEDQDFTEASLIVEDAEDAVSLGGDEDDEFLTYQSRVSQSATQRTQSPSKTVYHTEKQEMTAGVDARGKAPERDRPRTPTRPPQETQTAPESIPALSRQLSFGKLTHALPPKPVVSSVPFMHPSHPSIIEATAMAARIDRDKKNGIVPKSTTFDSGDALPPDWEVRHPRNGRGVYYYNSRSKESTWTRPGSSTSARDRRDSRIADDTRDMAAISMTDDSLTSRIGRSDADTTLSYDDRHYRPGESTRRDERPPMQSHHGGQNDSFLAPNRANGERSPSPPPRHRPDDRAPSSRRQQSPSANGDRNRGRASKKEPPRPSSPIAAVDRIWVAPRDLSPVDRPAVHEGKHREAEKFPHKEHERRETPRDADRMSATSTLSASSPILIPPRRVCSSSGAGRDALKASRATSRVELRSTIFCSFLFDFFLAWTHGPRSPINHSRDGRHPPTSLSSNDSGLAHTGLASVTRQKSRFSQAASAHIDRRSPDIPDRSRDMRPQGTLGTDSNRTRYRTNDRHQADARAHKSPDTAPQTLPPAPLEQLVSPPSPPPIERSRKRSPLPPQRASFHEGWRSKADAGYPSSTPATRDHGPTSRLIINDAHVPSGPRASPLMMPRELRPDATRGSRQAPSSSAAYPNSQVDPFAPQESRGKRDKDQMDVDNPPPTRSTDPSRQLATNNRYRDDRDGSAPKRPRAMMDNAETSARRRSPDRPPQSRSEWKETRVAAAQEDTSRSVPVLQEERRPPVEPLARTIREPPRRQVDMSRPPPTAPMPKLSGTNSMPIGGRGNRFSGSASISPHPPLLLAPLAPPVTSALQRGIHVSASNAQPVSHSGRPASSTRESYERPPHLDVVHDRDRSFQGHADQRQPGGHVVSPHLPSKPLSMMPDPPASRPVDTALPSRSVVRPSKSRFGPPVKRVEGNLELTSKRGQTPESPQSHQYDDRATSPPPSRDSSVTSLRAHTSHRHHVDDSSHSRVPEPRSSATERKEEKELPDRHSSGRNDHHGHGPTSQAHIAEKRVDESQWSKSRDLPPQDPSPLSTVMVSLPSGQHTANGEGSQVQQSPPPAMHPERARLLQKGTHGLPPRPETEPRRPRSTRPRYSDAGPRAPIDSRSMQPMEDISFRGDRRPPNNRGNSLIDRLAVDGRDASFSSLRDRVKVPMKRPQDDMAGNDGAMDVDDVHEGKRSRRRGGKLRKPRRGMIS